MSVQEVNARALAEHEAWVRELEAERVTHSYESLAEVVRRVKRERVESPAVRLARQRREVA